MEYEYVSDVVGSFFNYSHGLPTSDDESRLLSALDRAEYKHNLTKEVVSSLADASFSWLSLLRKYDFAQNHEITTETEAGLWAKECLLDRYLT